jgi:hypothetical protein
MFKARIYPFNQKTKEKALKRAFAVLLPAVFVLVIVTTFLPVPDLFDVALLSVTPNSLGPTLQLGLLREVIPVPFLQDLT